VTKGVGHGLGLSQYTANEMAKEGKNYKEILQFFFEGTEVKEVAEILWKVE
jgi:stage II sporulation protein D